MAGACFANPLPARTGSVATTAWGAVLVMRCRESTFTGTFDYSLVSNPVDLFGNPHIYDDIEVAGAAGTVFPAERWAVAECRR